MEDRRNEQMSGQDDDDILDLGLVLRSFWRIFSRMWWLVLILVVLGAGGYFTFQKLYNQPLYACSATFTVATGDEGSGSYSFYYDSSTADQLSKTFPYILDSSFFQSALLEHIGANSLNGTITAETVENSNVVTMRAESPDPETARAILDAALEIYPETARFVLGDIQFHYLNEPETPQEPFNGVGTKRSLTMGAGIGGLLGIFILGVMALVRRTARTPEEMKKITSLRCLAMIPEVHFKARKKNTRHNISVLNRRLSYGYRESVRALELRLENIMEKEGRKILLVASTVSGEGKSTLAINLCELMAEKGKNVVLIDGDLRKQQDAVTLGVSNGGGLQAIVDGDRPMTECFQKLKKSGFWFVGSRQPVKQPAAVLSSPRLGEFLQALKEEVDYIVIDTPPCEMFQDAGILAESADAILYVVKYDTVPQRQILDGISFLRDRKSRFLGYVFNSYPEAVSEYGYGRYGYGYGRYGRYGHGYYSGEKTGVYGAEAEND